ncbi:RNA ligase family protein [Mesorhizobium sp. YM1C-6-2]|uniref:ATP-dependent DNA ligase n=1 Tax=Mesorhizobium sp. YM1C-6-2 TaxID=1827501 RepID=UPI0011C48FD1|nr:RNA ligase family protein [Mesorhizobium sp. YM1C-6-2]
MRAQFIEPMLASLVEQPPDGAEWIHEIKHDGYRTLLALEDGKVQAFTRRGADWTAKYGAVVREVAGLPVRSAILDGEMTVLNADGRSDYRAFKKAIKSSPGRLVFIAFDMLMIDGKDVRGETTIERRERLQIVLDDPPTAIQFSEAVQGGGKAFYQAADAMGLEGIVSKRAKASYIGGRTRAWLKIKSYAISELEVAGVLEGRGKPTMALMVDRQNNYRGGAFITNRGIKERLLARVRAKRLPLPKGMKAKPEAKWLEPGVMATVRHLRGEEDLRHASVEEIIREQS